MKKKHLIALVVAVLFVGVAAFALVDNKIDYADLSKARETGKRVQISGELVKEYPAVYDAKQNLLTFKIRDHKGDVIEARYNGIKPLNFDVAPSVVCVGKIEGDVFAVSEIQTKCPSRYEGSEAPKAM